MLIFFLLFSKDIELLQSSSDCVEFIYNLTEYKMLPFPYVPDAIYSEEIGNPKLPARYVLIGIPPGAKINYQLVSFETKETTNVDILPVGYEFYKFYGKVYKEDDYLPQNIVEVDKIDTIRGQVILYLKLNLMRYNPISKHLIIYKKLRIKVNFFGVGGVPHYDKHFEDIFQDLLINYNECKNWRKEIKKKKDVGKVNLDWYKIEIKEEGVYKIPFSEIKKLGANYVNPMTIKIYNGGSKWIPCDTLIEVPIYVLPDTSIIFYGASLSGWGKNDKNYHNPYSDTNVYWLTYGGSYGRRDSIIVSVVVSSPPEYFIDTLHMEEENECPSNSGLRWIWQTLERQSGQETYTKEFNFNLNNLYNSLGDIYIYLYGKWYGSENEQDSSTLNMQHNVRIYLNGKKFLEKNWVGGELSPRILNFTADNLQEGNNILRIELFRGNSTKNDIIYFDYFEVVYKKRFTAHNGRIKFKGDGEFKVNNFQSKPIIWQINDELQPKRICGFKYENNTVSFSGESGVYFSSNNFLIPIVKKANPYNLRDKQTAIDYIIITPTEFIDYANRIKRHREKDGLIVCVFTLPDIYNNFSWGITHSPYSIKNFLKFAYENYEQPAYCLLFGAGTHAYKLNIEKNRVPVYQTGYLVGQFGYPPQKHYCEDTWFSHDLCISRITVKDNDEARDIVDKIINYENNYGVWRNRILLIADNGGTFLSEEENTVLPALPKDVDVIKFYTDNYQPGVDIKREARNDFIRVFSWGWLLTFYAGHGNIEQLSHAQIFLRDNIYLLRNGLKLPFSYFWSCGVGAFDRMYVPSMADLLQKVKDKGSIGSVAEARTSTSSFRMNRVIAREFFKQPTIGKTLYKAFIETNFPSNVMSFTEPGIKTQRNINVVITDTCDTLQGGKIFKIKGIAIGAKYAYLTVSSSEYEKVIHNIPIKMRGKVKGDTIFCEVFLFEGMTKVKNDNFEFNFSIPVIDSSDNLTYGNNGKLTVFVWNENNCGSKGIENIVILPGGKFNDTLGPEVSLFAENIPLTDSAEVPSKFNLTGKVKDASGIDLFHTAENLAFTIRIDKNEPIPLSPYFQYDLGNFTQGTFTYPIELDERELYHDLTLRVSDNAGNITIHKVNGIKIIPSDRLTITNAIAYPTPVRGEHLYFSFTLSRQANVSVKIYTVTGRLIRTIPEIEFLPGRNKIYWDTRDELGNRVGNGIYIYKIIAKSEEPTKEEDIKIAKFMIIR